MLCPATYLDRGVTIILWILDGSRLSLARPLATLSQCPFWLALLSIPLWPSSAYSRSVCGRLLCSYLLPRHAGCLIAGSTHRLTNGRNPARVVETFGIQHFSIQSQCPSGVMGHCLGQGRDRVCRSNRDIAISSTVGDWLALRLQGHGAQTYRVRSTEYILL